MINPVKHVYKIALNNGLLRDVYHLRYCVFVEEKKKYVNQMNASHEIKDELDDQHASINIIGYDRNIPVGTIRLTQVKPDNNELKHTIYDFTRYLSHSICDYGIVSMLVIKKQYRNLTTLASLLKIIGAIARKKGIIDLYFVADRSIKPLLLRIGGTQLDDEYHSLLISADIIPMKISLNSSALTYRPSSDFVSDIAIDSDLENLLNS